MVREKITKLWYNNNGGLKIGTDCNKILSANHKQTKKPAQLKILKVILIIC